VDDAEDKAKALLDINPEGELLREVKDILDELHIMLNIKNKQQRVFKQFRKHVTSILAPGLALSKEIGTAKLKKLTGDGDSKNEDNDSSEKKKTRSEAEAKAERDTKWTLEYQGECRAHGESCKSSKPSPTAETDHNSSTVS
jgi:hypothetical protein